MYIYIYIYIYISMRKNREECNINSTQSRKGAQITRRSQLKADNAFYAITSQNVNCGSFLLHNKDSQHKQTQ